MSLVNSRVSAPSPGRNFPGLAVLRRRKAAILTLTRKSIDLLISINHLLISINELEISRNELEISRNELEISINVVSASIFIDINNLLIDINK